jgi:hypothetical protein
MRILLLLNIGSINAGNFSSSMYCRKNLISKTTDDVLNGNFEIQAMFMPFSDLPMRLL